MSIFFFFLFPFDNDSYTQIPKEGLQDIYAHLSFIHENEILDKRISSPDMKLKSVVQTPNV